MSTMKSLTACAALLLLVAVAGCKGNQQSATSGSTSANPYASMPESASLTPATTPEQLGELGAQIKKQPNDAHKLLLQHGLTEASFAAAIRKVSEDPAAAKRYAAAYKQYSG